MAGALPQVFQLSQSFLTFGPARAGTAYGQRLAPYETFFPELVPKQTKGFQNKLRVPKKRSAGSEAGQRAVSARVHPESGPLRAGAPKGGKWAHKIINFLLVL